MSTPSQYYYSQHKKLDSISFRLKNDAKEFASNPGYTEKQIISSNLEFNLALLIAKLIINSNYYVPVQSDLDKLIEDYNIRNHTILTYAKMKDMFWVREINGKIIIPENVRFIRSQSRFDSADARFHYLECIEEFSKKFENISATLERGKLSAILDEWPTKINIEFLSDHDIIKSESDPDVFRITGGNYLKHLRNEIAAILWNFTVKPSENLRKFREFIEIIIFFFSYWPDEMTHFLTPHDINTLKRSSMDLLKSEQDLVDWGKEIEKIFVDAHVYAHMNLGSNVSDIFFKSKNPNDLLDELKLLDYGNGAVDYQPARNAYSLIISLLLQNDYDIHKPYCNIRNLLNDIKRPFLVYYTYHRISRSYPEVIPYLLLDYSLIPLFFKLISSIKVRTPFAIEPGNRVLREKEQCEFINKFWIDGFDYALSRFDKQDPEDYPPLCISIADVLEILSKQLFTFNRNSYDEATIRHQSIKERYNQIKSLLKGSRVIISNGTKSKLYPLIIPYLFVRIIKPTYLVRKNEFIQLPCYKIQILNDLAKICEVPQFNTEISKVQQTQLLKIRKQLFVSICKHIRFFFTVERIDILSIYSRSKRTAKIDGNFFGLEIIDWGYLFLNLDKYKLFNTLDKEIKGKIKINTSPLDAASISHNMEQAEKVSIYIRILLLAHIYLYEQKPKNGVPEPKDKKALEQIEEKVKNYSLRFSVENTSKNKMDVFNENYNWYTYNTQSLTSLLFTAVKDFEYSNQEQFVNSFFKSSFNVCQMFIALNQLNSKNIHKLILKRIESFNVPDLVKNMNIRELEETLIEVINSDTHFNKADLLIAKIEEYLKKGNLDTERTKDFLFRIRLLLAFRKKDKTLLEKIEFPSYPHQVEVIKVKDIRQKNFYEALFNLYNEDNYENAITILEELLIAEPKNTEFAFHLFRSKIFKNLNDVKGILETKIWWDDFRHSLDLDELKQLGRYTESINSLQLRIYFTEKDYIGFDQTINLLSEQSLYNEDLIPVIYDCFIERQLEDRAFSYITDAMAFYEREGHNPVKVNLYELKSKALNDELMKKFRDSLLNLRSLPPDQIPSILPQILNGNKDIRDFILVEILQGLRVLRKKIKAIESINWENKYNDVFQSILKLRFPLWGWDILDQERSGSSPSNKDAGEVDFTIKAVNDLTIIEAFILVKRNFKITQEHLLKCINYSRDLYYYYIIVYYKGHRSKFEETWENYKIDVKKIAFPEEWKFKLSEKFNKPNLLNSYAENLKVAYTDHGNSFRIYHIMIDLSEAPSLKIKEKGNNK